MRTDFDATRDDFVWINGNYKKPSIKSAFIALLVDHVHAKRKLHEIPVLAIQGDALLELTHNFTSFQEVVFSKLLNVRNLEEVQGKGEISSEEITYFHRLKEQAEKREEVCTNASQLVGELSRKLSDVGLKSCSKNPKQKLSTQGLLIAQEREEKAKELCQAIIKMKQLSYPAFYLRQILIDVTTQLAMQGGSHDLIQNIEKETLRVQEVESVRKQAYNKLKPYAPLAATIVATLPVPSPLVTEFLLNLSTLSDFE